AGADALYLSGRGIQRILRQEQADADCASRYQIGDAGIALLHDEREKKLRRSGALLDDLPLEDEHARRQFGILGLEQEGVEAAAMIDAFKRIRGNPQPERAAERVRDQRDVEQVGQKPPLGLAVRMAHLVPDLTGLAG